GRRGAGAVGDNAAGSKPSVIRAVRPADRARSLRPHPSSRFVRSGRQHPWVTQDEAEQVRRYEASHSHGISEAWITSLTPSPPTERIARSTSLRPKRCVVTSSTGKRLEAICARASSQAR